MGSTAAPVAGTGRGPLVSSIEVTALLDNNSVLDVYPAWMRATKMSAGRGLVDRLGRMSASIGRAVSHSPLTRYLAR